MKVSVEKNEQMFDEKNCPVCATFKQGNVCANCGKVHEPNEHFYGSKSLHFHMVATPTGTSKQTVTAELCEKCYAEDMHELTGSWPVEFAPHHDKASATYGA